MGGNTPHLVGRCDNRIGKDQTTEGVSGMKAGLRARYTLEVKQEAVRLVSGGEKLSSVARTLGVSAQSLDNWVVKTRPPATPFKNSVSNCF